MRLLAPNQIQLMESLIKTNQSGMKKTLSQYLKSKYKRVVETKDYLYAIGDIPIALVAHMDTVFETSRGDRELYYDKQKNVMFCPDGAGFDDKVGIFAIIQIFRQGLRPHVIFTTDEEKGCLGAEKLAKVKCPFNDIRYLIQLDRRGADDCVFYECDNPLFTRYIEDFGFVEAIGTFSDISVICPSWKIAGVNLSVGYQNEHSTSEILFVGHLLNTIDKVCNLLKDNDVPQFEYIPLEYANYCNAWYRHYKKAEDDNHCHICKKEFLPEELIPVNMQDMSVKNFCVDCMVGRADFCVSCGEAYEIMEKEEHPSGLCEDCWYDLYYGHH